MRYRAMSVVVVFVWTLASGANAYAAEELHPLAGAIREKLKDPKKPFTIVVKLKAKEGMTDKFEAALTPAIKATRKEKGCLRYELNRDTEDTHTYILYERWNSLADLDAHLKSEHITKLFKEMEELAAGAPDVKVLLPAAE